MSTVLVLAPHADDGELGCGGTIARFVEEGKNVYYVAFSIARSSVKPGFDDDVLATEMRQATAVLGIPEANVKHFDYPVRHFPEYRQEILEELIGLKESIQPETIFVPALSDIHQDHQVISQEGLRAFKRHTILAYEEPWNNIVFETRHFIILAQKHVEKKVEALRCYRSQAHRKYLDEGFIRSLATIRGTQIEGGLAEAFEVLRWVLPIGVDI